MIWPRRPPNSSTGVPVPCHSATSGARCTAFAEVLVVTRFMRCRSAWNGAESVIGSEPMRACVIIIVSLESSNPRTEDGARRLFGPGHRARRLGEERELQVEVDELLTVVHRFEHDVPVGLALLQVGQKRAM